jgi:alpha-1,3-rhamnosyl/mannosyltransferase
MERHVPNAVALASIVLTDSQFIRDEVIALLGADARKVMAVPLGASEGCVPADQEESAPVLARYDLAYRNYLLTVGTLEPRKNLIQVLRAYRALPERFQAQVPLAMAGLRGWKSEALDRELAAVRSRGRVRVLGYVPEADLYRLYSGALAFVYPSLYEGFGLPPLEAMACAAPVIVSNRSSLPEVVGEAGVLCDPDDVDELRDAILRVAEDPGERERLIHAGLAQAGQFSWDRCASQTIEAYRRSLDPSYRSPSNEN